MTESLNTQPRIRSIDIIRGLVMVLMAIDHVRVYSGVPPGGPEAGVFFTRWVTHFCAPAFAFLAGTAAFFHGQKLSNNGKLARYLVVRGLILVFLEMTLIRFLWAFHVDFSEFALAGVIWMLGWCMVLLAALIWMRPLVVGIIGVVIILSQRLFSFIPRLLPESIQGGFGGIWEFIYPSGFESAGGIIVLYVIVPWIGVMAAGYGFGLIMKMDATRRNKICIYLGASLTFLFIVIGSIIILSTPSDENQLPFILNLLNQRKYPASPLYLMMTLGPVILLMPFVETAKGWFVNVFTVIGRVPFFYYLLHILIINISALTVQIIQSGTTHPEWFMTAPYSAVPEEARWSLALLYLVFIADVIILYFACRWYARYKSAHPDNKILSFI